ncbi:hypothetical protein D9Q98_010205 [Chlorella vulgaris]|uniref:Protein kinase domain-containing protein n=1 Tax=Chlorella vulgaris TaxID=3077 RepID=A0A9D4YWL0_CHLVU|nr:hypothetical protein D9Q98_010205 [Chlorella vulgaris]
MRDAVENWDEFSAANAIHGWDAASPPCTWGGITCSDDGTILTLSWQCRLPTCAVPAVGTLPADLGTIRSLATLDLQGNRFYGTLPRRWGEIDMWPSLHNLYVNGNNLSGVLPDWGTPGTFPQLSTLGLDSNRLNGTLPTIWGSPRAMTYLRELYLQDNLMSGGLPASWGTPNGMPSLGFFSAGNNPLGGTLPAEWGQNASFPQLKTLDLNNSRLFGTLPPSWGDPSAMTQLDALRIERNDLSGSIPAAWQAHTNLSRLVLAPGNPRLCGPIPPNLPFSLCDDTDLTCLRVPVNLNTSCGPILAPPPLAAPAAEPAATSTGPAAAALHNGAAVQQPAGSQAAAPTNGDSGTSSSSDSSGGGGGTSTGLIVGCAVGGAAAAAILAALLCLMIGRRRRQEQREQQKKEQQQNGFKPSACPFVAEEEEYDPERGGGSGSDPCKGGSGFIPAVMASPFAAATSSRTFSAAPSTATQLSGTKTPGSLDRRPSRLASMLQSSGILPSSSDSVLYRWCSDARTASMELPPPAGPEAAAAGGGMHVMMQIAEEGEVGSSGVKKVPPAAVGAEGVEQRPPSSSSCPLRSLSPRAGSEGAATRAFSTTLPWSDWEMRIEEVDIARRPDGSEWLLGSGGFGRVYKGLRHGVQPVAVKIIPVRGDQQHPAAQAEVRQEIAILRACRDVNIVQFVGAHLGGAETRLVTEYMDGGDLLHNIAAGRVSWYRRGKKIALDVARGLVFLHSRRIVHFDLKSPNILLARDGTGKIGDVGMAKIMNRDYVTGVVSTLAWSAPEMLWGARCTEKVDIYSFGIVLWEICSGQAPERGRLRDVRVPQECPQEARLLILQCLDASPSKRPTALQLVEQLTAIPATPPADMPPLQSSPAGPNGARQTAPPPVAPPPVVEADAAEKHAEPPPSPPRQGLAAAVGAGSDT